MLCINDPRAVSLSRPRCETLNFQSKLSSVPSRGIRSQKPFSAASCYFGPLVSAGFSVETTTATTTTTLPEGIRKSKMYINMRDSLLMLRAENTMHEEPTVNSLDELQKNMKQEF